MASGLLWPRQHWRNLAAVVVAACIAFPAQAKTITRDRGGEVIKYYNAVKALRKSGERVRIDGQCGSACTMHLALSNLCATARAQFVFHDVILQGGSDERVRRLYRKEIWRSYPGWVKSWITARGGLTKRELIMPRKDIRLPACN